MTTTTTRTSTAANADPIEHWLDRVTGRLAVDRELQLEVRLELRSHVDESIEEFRTAGRNESDARDEALRALGDEAELSDQLWRANRRRMKLRALAVWAARLVLTPAAVALALLLSLGTLTSFAVLTNDGPGSSEYFPGDAILAERARSAAAAHAAPDVRLLIEQAHAPAGEQLALARRLVELSPDDRALRANLALSAMFKPGVTVTMPETPSPASQGPAITGLDDTVTYGGADPSNPPPPPEPVIEIDAAQLDATLAIFAEGERRDPDNALYPLLRASVLFQASTYTRDDKVHTVKWPGDVEPSYWQELVVKDPARHALAVAEVRRAAAKPSLRTYAADLVRRQLDALPARTIEDLSVRVSVQPGRRWGWPLPASIRQLQFLSQTSGDEALRLAHAGGAPAAEVDGLLADARTLARLLAADAESSLELRFAFNGYVNADAQEAYVWAARGDRARAEACWARYLALNDKLNARSGGGAAGVFEYEKSGLLSSPSLVRQDALDTAPVRRAEYAAVDQLGFGATSASLLVLATLYGLWALLRWILVRRAAIAPRLFVGWRRSAVVVLGGVVLPMALYLAYARLTPLGGRADGLNRTLIRITIEYGVVGGVVLLLASVLAGWAAAARMRELRITPPKLMMLRTLTTWPRSAAIALGLALLCLLIALFMPLITREFRFGSETWLCQVYALAAAAVLVAFAVGVRLGDARARHEAETAAIGDAGAAPSRVIYGWYARAAFAPLLMSAVTLGVLGLPLRLVEARAVHDAVASGQPVVYLGIADRSVLKDVRDQLLTTGQIPITPAESAAAMKRYAEQMKQMREMTP